MAAIRTGRQLLGACRDGESPGRDPRTDTDDEVEAKLERTVAQLIDDDGNGCSRICVHWSGGTLVRSGLQEEAFAAWRRFFEALAEEHPLVLVFEDVQWADDGLLDFIEHLADWVA